MDFHNMVPPLAVDSGLDDDVTWSEKTTPWLDSIEDVVRQSTQLRGFYGDTLSPRHERPIRRRLRSEDPQFKSHQTFTMTSIPVLELRGSLDSSEPSSTSSPLTIVTSTTSSAGTPWSTSGRVEEIFEDEEAYNGDATDHSYQDRDSSVPKTEPTDDLDMEALYDTEDTPMQSATTPSTNATSLSDASLRRPRGRPRKHPKREPEPTSRVHKGRSKTGCATCRRRKKKCDEAKPKCENCRKNGVECEGYRQLQPWKSGKEKKQEEELKKRHDTEEVVRRGSITEIPCFPLPHLFLGVETEGDRIFFKHYTDRLSIIFTMEGETESAFRKIVLPIAQHDKGLMHSILSLASRHIDYSSPYGAQLLLDHPTVSRKQLEERSEFHHKAALAELIRRQADSNLSPTHCQIVCLVLQTLSDPNPTGEHRLHLEFSQKLPRCNQDPELHRFLEEFYGYHIYADQLTCLPQPGHPLISFHSEWNLPSTVLQPDAMPLLGVSDGLFLYMSQITNIRNRIRENLKIGIDPAVNYRDLYDACVIDAGIREWKPVWRQGDPRDPAGKLYKHMMWVYLFRTIYPPRATDWKLDRRITDAVNEGIAYIGLISPKSKLQTVLLAPTFLIGCAAFEPEQRQKIREAIAVVKAYMEYRNSDTALMVLEEVWRLMDLRDERSWDWQNIAHGLNMDFLAT